MKKFYLLFLIISFSLNSFTQPVITSAHYPVAGESFSGNIDFPSVWNPGTSGANQTWDFSTLAGGSATVTYEDPASTSYAASFSTSNVALSQAGTAYLYYNSTSSQVDITGTVTLFPSANTRVYNDPQTVITFPFTFNDNFKDTADTGIIPAPGVNRTQRRVTYSETTADGYGTLTLPGSTSFSNVLRILIASEVIDSTFDSGNFLSENISTDSQYYFISEDYKPHVLALTKNISPNGTTLLAQYFLSPSTPTSVIKPENSYVTIFPNPAKSEITVEIDQNKFSNTAALIFQLYTNTGTTAYQEVRINQATQKIPLNNLNPGLYFYQLKDEDDLLQSGKVLIV